MAEYIFKVEKDDVNDEAFKYIDETFEPLIRCKDCRYCEDSGKSKALKCTYWWYIDVDPEPDFYCAHAERKEE